MPISLTVKLEAMKTGLPNLNKLLRPSFQCLWTNLDSTETEFSSYLKKNFFNDKILLYSVSWNDPNSSNSKNYPTGFLSLIWGLLLNPLNIDEMLGFPGGSDGKESACKEGDLDSVPGLERSPAGGNDNPLQYSCLENSMDRGETGRLHSPWGRKESDMTE